MTLDSFGFTGGRKLVDPYAGIKAVVASAGVFRKEDIPDTYKDLAGKHFVTDSFLAAKVLAKTNQGSPSNLLLALRAVNGGSVPDVKGAEAAKYKADAGKLDKVFERFLSWEKSKYAIKDDLLKLLIACVRSVTEGGGWFSFDELQDALETCSNNSSLLESKVFLFMELAAGYLKVRFEDLVRPILAASSLADMEKYKSREIKVLVIDERRPAEDITQALKDTADSLAIPHSQIDSILKTIKSGLGGRNPNTQQKEAVRFLSSLWYYLAWLGRSPEWTTFAKTIKNAYSDIDGTTLAAQLASGHGKIFIPTECTAYYEYSLKRAQAKQALHFPGAAQAVAEVGHYARTTAQAQTFANHHYNEIFSFILERGVNPTSLFSKQVWQRYIVKDKTVPAGYRLI